MESLRNIKEKEVEIQVKYILGKSLVYIVWVFYDKGYLAPLAGIQRALYTYGILSYLYLAFFLLKDL